MAGSPFGFCCPETTTSGAGERIAHYCKRGQSSFHLLGCLAVAVPDAGLQLVEALELPFVQPRSLNVWPACQGAEEGCPGVGRALQAEAACHSRERATTVAQCQGLLVRVRLPAPRGWPVLSTGLAIERLFSVPRPAATHSAPQLTTAS